MLIGVDLQQLDCLVNIQLRQAHLLGMLATHRRFFIHAEKTRLANGRATDAKSRILGSSKFHRDRVHDRRNHLAGHGATPDQRVQLELVFIQIRLQALRRPGRVGRTDGLVGFLRIARFGGVKVGLFRHLVSTELTADLLAQGIDRLAGQRHRIGAHVGDQTLGAGIGGNAFVQLLCQAHAALRRIAQFARGVLLHGRGDIGRWRSPPALTFLHLGNVQRAGIGAITQCALHRLRLILVGEAELFDFLALPAHQRGLKVHAVLVQIGGDGPVFLRLETLDLFFALDDQAQGRRLHTAGGQTRLQLFPQQRRQIEADQVIQRPARLLRIDQIIRQHARIGDRMLHGVFGDLAEHHAINVALAVEQFLVAQNLLHVPGYGLAFAIKVGGKIDVFGAACGLDQLVHVLLVALDELVVHGKISIGIDRAGFRHQVADMSVRRQHLKILAQIFIDRARLGRRFHDQKVIAHQVFCIASSQ